VPVALLDLDVEIERALHATEVADSSERKALGFMVARVATMSTVDRVADVEKGSDMFNEQARVFYGRFFCSIGNLRYAHFNANIKSGLLTCAPWQVLSDVDLNAVLGPDGDIIIEESGRYRRAV